MNARASLRRIAAIARKEALQALRDPATWLIAFVLPVLLLLLFTYAVSLDLRRVPLGVVQEGSDAPSRKLVAAFVASPHFKVRLARERRELDTALSLGEIKGYVVIPADLARRMQSASDSAWLQIITDGAQPNSARFVANYAQGVVQSWLQELGLQPAAGVQLQPRFWFNPEVESRRYLIPGAIAIVMTMIGTLLTALVVAREWERGSMEALLATPARLGEILLGKLLPYFVLGLLACSLTVALALWGFGLPLRGSFWLLLVSSALFLLPALGQGLLISALARNQFLAAQAALFTGFLPAFLLSGFLFEVDAMPAPIRWLSSVVPARYYIITLQNEFLAGSSFDLLWPNWLALLLLGGALLTLARRAMSRQLD